MNSLFLVSLAGIFVVVSPVQIAEAVPAPDSVRCFMTLSNDSTPCPDTDDLVGPRPYVADKCYEVRIQVVDRTPSLIRRGCPEDIVAPTTTTAGELPDCTSNQGVQAAAGACNDRFGRCPASSTIGGVAVGDSRPYGFANAQNECREFDPSDVPPLEENPIVLFLGDMINFLTAGIGFILTILLVVAGIRYTLARGNPQESAGAKSMIEKVVISVILYLFAFALINWLIPGGLLN